MHKLAHILRLGLKELTSLRHDSVLLLFLFYAFTVAIYMPAAGSVIGVHRSEEHTSELQSLRHLVCRLLLEKKKKTTHKTYRELVERQ